MTWQIHGALLALHVNRPVKFLYSRQEAFLARYHRHPSKIWIRHHANRDGRLVKLEARILYEGGPYSHTSEAGIGNGVTLIQGTYKIPNAKVEGWAVGTNNGMCGPLRGFGVLQAIFACESNMDKLAKELRMDPNELRSINALTRGDRWIFNQVQDRPTPVQELLARCNEMPLPPPLPDAQIHPINLPGGIASPTRPEHIKRGVAINLAAKNVCLSEGAPVNSTAMVTLRNGKATIDCAAAEVGQGFVTIARQIVQTTLGVSSVHLNEADTNMPPAATTDGSQQTVTSGEAVHLAAKTVKQRFLKFYAREHALDINKIDIKDDHVIDHNGCKLATLSDAGKNLIFRATEIFEQRETRPVDDSSSDAPVHVTIGFSASRCVVDVDVELGLVKVVQMDVVQDIGKVVNPIQAIGQIEGGAVQGMGLALMENLKYVDGHPTNVNWQSYHIPTIADAPVINAEFICYPEPGYNYGWKGIGELPHVQAPASVLAALRAVTSLDIPFVPATPEDIAQVVDNCGGYSLSQSFKTTVNGPWKAPISSRKIGPWNK